MKTSEITKKKALNLSKYLFNEITDLCQFCIDRSEEATVNWIKMIERKFNVIA